MESLFLIDRFRGQSSSQLSLHEGALDAKAPKSSRGYWDYFIEPDSTIFLWQRIAAGVVLPLVAPFLFFGCNGGDSGANKPKDFGVDVQPDTIISADGGFDRPDAVVSPDVNPDVQPDVFIPHDGGVADMRSDEAVDRSEPEGDTWMVATTMDAPSARSGHTAVWTGSEMIVWGGANYASDTFGFENTGGRYNPATDSWLATSIAEAPSARDSHTAVWTGSEMIVWGGVNTLPSFVLEDAGGRYNPATDRWVATSTVDAPSARSGHTAVWTGSEMIVWGGVGELDNEGNGSRYDPATDSWAAISAIGIPSSIFANTAVWTGSEMIVWGGAGVSAYENYVNNGGRYNPSTDTWRTVSATDAPSARRIHTAVWTGSEMIVWGGQNAVGYENTGGRYNPVTDRWTATSTVDAPSARQFHTAVWTGSEMIGWGGEGYEEGLFIPLKSGSRYDPATDSWTATSLVNATRRKEHTSVWTGSEMIEWGGRNALTYQNTGGRYRP